MTMLDLFVVVGWIGAWPSAALNVVWVGIGAVALWRICDRRGQAEAR